MSEQESKRVLGQEVGQFELCRLHRDEAKVMAEEFHEEYAQLDKEGALDINVFKRYQSWELVLKGAEKQKQEQMGLQQEKVDGARGKLREARCQTRIYERMRELSLERYRREAGREYEKELGEFAIQQNHRRRRESGSASQILLPLLLAVFFGMAILVGAMAVMGQLDGHRLRLIAYLLNYKAETYMGESVNEEKLKEELDRKLKPLVADIKNESVRDQVEAFYQDVLVELEDEELKSSLVRKVGPLIDDVKNGVIREKLQTELDKSLNELQNAETRAALLKKMQPLLAQLENEEIREQLQEEFTRFIDGMQSVEKKNKYTDKRDHLLVVGGTKPYVVHMKTLQNLLLIQEKYASMLREDTDDRIVLTPEVLDRRKQILHKVQEIVVNRGLEMESKLNKVDDEKKSLEASIASFNTQMQQAQQTQQTEKDAKVAEAQTVNLKSFDAMEPDNVSQILTSGMSYQVAVEKSLDKAVLDRMIPYLTKMSARKRGAIMEALDQGWASAVVARLEAQGVP